jgi:hypothetical protein
MDSFDSFLTTMYVIAICAGVLFFLGLIAEIAWPWWEDRKPRAQATYRRSRP